jgi:hypothetical protein
MYTAVIIEPREHKALGFVLHNFFTNLPDWKFMLFHGNNKKFIDALFETDLKPFKHRIIFVKLDTDNLTSKQYNSICKSSAFYKCINTDILLFQTDTLILNKELLHDFLKYDYVGAPWRNGMVGNGGLSLRNKNKMIEICETVEDFTENEDNYFCYQPNVSLYKPSYGEAQTFSVETIFHEKSFGIHAPWKHLTTYEMNYLINKYPDIATLITLNT